MADLLVLWDLDYTLVNANGLGTRLYEVVFRELFGRELPAVAPKAGRTDRAIITDTLALAGIPADREQVDRFLAALARLAAAPDGAVPGPVRPLPALPPPSRRWPPGRRYRQSVLTGNVTAMAALKLRRAGLGADLDLDAGAYGDVHEVRAELVTVARRAARRSTAWTFPGQPPSWSATRRWTWRPRWPPGRGRWPSRPAATPRRTWPRRARTWSCPT